MGVVTWRWDTSEVSDLADDIRKVEPRMKPHLVRAVKESADAIEEGWRNHAIGTSGTHGKHYPYSIKAHAAGFNAIIEPDASMPQGGMAFEYGGPSVIGSPDPTDNNPPAGSRVGQSGPHLSMNITMDIQDPLFVKRIADTAIKHFDL